MKKGTLLFFLFLLPPLFLYAGMAIPLDLKTMTRQAGPIFVGICLEAEKTLDERGFPCHWIRIRVEEGVQGVQTGEEIWIKQFGERRPFSCNSGEEYLLFLYPESDYGFTSAVGLGQGQMKVVHPASGPARVEGLFPHLQEEIGGRTLEELLELLRHWGNQ